MGDVSEGRVTEESKSFSTQSIGYLFSKIGLLVLLACLLLAAWAGQVVIVVLLGLVLSVAGLAKLWSAMALKGVTCERQLNERRVFPGEEVELKLRVVNRKLMPLPWVQIDDTIPLALDPSVVQVEGCRVGCGLLSKSAALLWYSGVNWKHRLLCKKRGFYKLGPLSVTSGDIFGLYPCSQRQEFIDHIIVYPRIFPINHLGLPSLYPLGDTLAEKRIFEDPARTIGVRDYTPHDSLRRIHWKATARRRSLQVKVFEPTTTLKVALMLAVDSFGYGTDRYSEENFELGVSAIASIANLVAERRSQVGLYVNTRLIDSEQPAVMAPGGGAGQLTEILETLAKTTAQSIGPFEEFLQSVRSSLVWGTTLIVVLSEISVAVNALLMNLRENGYKLVIIQVGDNAGKSDGYAIEWLDIKNVNELMKVQ